MQYRKLPECLSAGTLGLEDYCDDHRILELTLDLQNTAEVNKAN